METLILYSWHVLTCRTQIVGQHPKLPAYLQQGSGGRGAEHEIPTDRLGYGLSFATVHKARGVLPRPLVVP